MIASQDDQPGFKTGNPATWDSLSLRQIRKGNDPIVTDAYSITMP